MFFPSLSSAIGRLLTVCVVPRRSVWGLFCIAFLTSELTAQEGIHWRYDYNAARKEATTKGLPLFLDFGTEQCFHCRRLDATTFREPSIIQLLNVHFVPLKVDGNAEPTLVQALRIKAYPTLIVARTDGKILSMLEGYMDAGRLHDHLQRAIANATPDWMARDFQEASKSLDNGDYARAVSLLTGILQDGKTRAVQVKASEILVGIERQAADRLAGARHYDDMSQPVKAVEVLADILKRYPGTQAASDATAMLAGISNRPDMENARRAGRASDLLAQAREAYRTGDYLQCLHHCEVLTGAYNDLPEHREAHQLTQLIQKDPQRLAQACENLHSELAGMYLVVADSWIEKGKPDQAREYLKKVVRLEPDSVEAQTAQLKLTDMDRSAVLNNPR